MKKILLIACLALLVGCSRSPKDVCGRYVAVQDKENKNVFIVSRCGATCIFEYIIVDEHEYLFSTYDRGVGIAHSPKCPKCSAKK